MTANVIAFAARTASRTARPLPAAASAAPSASRTADRHDNIVSIAAWIDRARPRRTPTGVFFTTGVLATQGFIA